MTNLFRLLTLRFMNLKLDKFFCTTFRTSKDLRLAVKLTQEIHIKES